MSDGTLVTELSLALSELEENKVIELVDLYIAEEKQPIAIIDELSTGMDEVGKLFKDGEYYLSELIFSGEIFKNAMAKVKPLIKTSEKDSDLQGKVIMGTVAGDIHDLGKNIVITLLESAGFQVFDLGVDVPSEKFVDALKDTNSGLIGLSALLTTAFDPMKDTIEAIKQAGLRDNVKIMIGGSPTSNDLKEIIGADFYGESAADAADIAKQVLGGK